MNVRLLGDRWSVTLPRPSSFTLSWRTKRLQLHENHQIFSTRIIRCASERNVNAYLGDRDRLRGISGKIRRPSAGIGRPIVYSSLLWLRTFIILICWSRGKQLTLPVLEYGSSIMVGTFCCDKNWRGCGRGCGNMKLCLIRGEMGINFAWVGGIFSEFSGFGSVFCRMISGERFRCCGDSWRFGGDVGNSLCCCSGLGRVFWRTTLMLRRWKSGSLPCSGDLL